MIQVRRIGHASFETPDLDRQIDHVLASLDSIPDHEKLHQLLHDLCRTASKGFERRLPPRLFAADLDDLDLNPLLISPAPTRKAT